MISGFVDPSDPLFIDINIPKYFNNMRNYGNLLTYYFCKSHILENQQIRFVGQIQKRRAPTNDDNPLNKISEIFDMRSISIKNMKWNFGIF